MPKYGADGHIEQLQGIARRLGWPGACYPSDLACDAAAIRRHGPQPFVFAIAPWGTQLYWFHLDPNPWKSLTAFLKSTARELPKVRYFIVGADRQPIEVPVGTSAAKVHERTFAAHGA